MLKIYWALVYGVPKRTSGFVDIPLRVELDGYEQKVVVPAKTTDRMPSFTLSSLSSSSSTYTYSYSYSTTTFFV